MKQHTFMKIFLKTILFPYFRLFFGRLGGNVGEWNFQKIEFWQNS